MSIFNLKCKIINQSVVINGSDITDTSDKVWIVQNGKYLTYPKIDHEQTWNFYLILSIFDFKCKFWTKMLQSMAETLSIQVSRFR